MFELLPNGITNHVVIIVHKRFSWNIENFCEWDFCHWAVHNVDADHKAIIVVLDLLGVRHFVIGFQKMCGPGWVAEGILRFGVSTAFFVCRDTKNTEEPKFQS